MQLYGLSQKFLCPIEFFITIMVNITENFKPPSKVRGSKQDSKSVIKKTSVTYTVKLSSNLCYFIVTGNSNLSTLYSDHIRHQLQ